MKSLGTNPTDEQLQVLHIFKRYFIFTYNYLVYILSVSIDTKRMKWIKCRYKTNEMNKMY